MDGGSVGPILADTTVLMVHPECCWIYLSGCINNAATALDVTWQLLFSTRGATEREVCQIHGLIEPIAPGIIVVKQGWVLVIARLGRGIFCRFLCGLRHLVLNVVFPRRVLAGIESGDIWSGFSVLNTIPHALSYSWTSFSGVIPEYRYRCQCR